MPNNLRVLLIHPHLQLFGGSERLTKILIYELASLGSEVVVLSSARDEREFPTRPNVKYEFISDVFTKIPSESILPLKTERIINIIYSIDEVVRRHRPNVCLVMIQEPIYVMAMKLIEPRMGTAIYIHYPFEEELTSENVYVFLSLYRFPHLYESMYKLADLHMTNSNYTALALYKSFDIESNVVYPAVDWEFFRNEPDIYEDREHTILSVGRFVPQKRHEVLLDWFKRYIKPEVPDAKLIIIGVPDMRFMNYYERLKKLASEMDDVTLVDRALSSSEMIKYYRQARIYVHLRIGEHFGMAPVEAMSQGLIPILPERSGLAELITPGRDGFTARDDDEFIKYIVKLLKMSKDELIEMRKFAYRRAWYFNPDRFAKEVLNYLKIIAR